METNTWLPSGNQTWKWTIHENPLIHGGLNGHFHLSMGDFPLPCLITGNWCLNHTNDATHRWGSGQTDIATPTQRRRPSRTFCLSFAPVIATGGNVAGEYRTTSACKSTVTYSNYNMSVFFSETERWDRWDRWDSVKASKEQTTS